MVLIIICMKQDIDTDLLSPICEELNIDHPKTYVYECGNENDLKFEFDYPDDKMKWEDMFDKTESSYFVYVFSVKTMEKQEFCRGNLQNLHFMWLQTCKIR